MFGIAFYCRKLARHLVALSIIATFATTASLASAACNYQIENEWNSGYVASITIKNDTGNAVSQWSVNWQFTQDQVSNSWNANLSGTNPYQATNMDWNGSLAPGQTASFGIQVNKNGASAERPKINGTLCTAAVSSSSATSSSIPSSSSSSSNSSVATTSSSATSSSSSSQPANDCPSQPENAFQMYAPKIPATIQAEDFDPAGYLDSSTANEGGAYRTDTGVDIKQIATGNAVGWMTAGEWLEYTIFVESEGDYDVTIRSGAVATGRTLKISQCNVTLLESFQVPTVNAWGEFKILPAGKIHLKPGYQKIRVTVGASDYVDLDWIHIGPYSGETDTPTNGTVPSPGCGLNRSLQNGWHSLTVGGLNRSYILRVPDNYDNQHPYRLVLGYHWLNGDATQVANGGNGSATETPYYGLWNLAQNSTIFIAPEGIDKGWANTNNRDLAFTDAILNQVQADMCIDKSRIFATGFSYGAGFSNAIACARADVFRGVALYSGAQLSGCNGGTSPIAYFATHGLSDDVLNISLGRALRDRFVTNNHCAAQSPAEPARGSGTHICTSYQGCTAGFPVRWCAFDGGHWPSQHDAGQANSWIPGEAWNFISQF